MPSLWIFAAEWEYQHNENFIAARGDENRFLTADLFQRGIRLNPKISDLWKSYFRAELQFVKEMKENIRSEDSSEQQKESVEVPELSQEKDIMRDEQSAGALNIQKETIQSYSTPFLQYAIPRAIFRNAILSIPKDFQMRVDFLSIYREYPETEEGQEEIYQSIQQDFPDNPN